MLPLISGSARGALPAAAALVTAMLVAVALANRALGVNPDESIYLLLADDFGRWFGHAAPPAHFAWRFNQFPPLYPLLLGVLGANSVHAPFARALSAILAGGATCAFVRWLAVEHLGGPVARWVCALGWLMLPYTLYLATTARSETAYAGASLLALVALGRARDGAGLMRAAGWVASAALIRSVGIALCAVFVWHAWRSRTPGRGRAIALATLPVAAWFAYRTLWLHPELDYLGDAYLRYHGRPAWLIVTTLVQSAGALWRGWQALFDIAHRGWPSILGAALLVPGLVATAVAVWRGAAAAHYAFLYVLVVLVWPYPDHATRFLWPVAPVFLGYGLGLVSSLPSRRIPLGIATAVFIAAIAPGWRHFAARGVEPMPPALADYRGSELWLADLPPAAAASNVRLIALVNASMQESGRLVPEGECVFSVHPERMMLLARRASRAPPLPAAAPAAFDVGIQACRYAHVVYTSGHPAYPAGYPAGRVADANVLARFDLPHDGRPRILAALLRLR